MSFEFSLCMRPIPGMEETEINTPINASQGHTHSLNSNSLLMLKSVFLLTSPWATEDTLCPEPVPTPAALSAVQFGEWATVR